MRNERHGLSKTRLYSIYSNMKQRCYNPNATSYHYYGERGISICDEWLEDFMNFYNWAMSNGYHNDLTIDRKESNGNYCPENCRWITLEENSRRGFGEKNENDITRIRELTNLSQQKFCEKYGIPLQTLRKWEQGNRNPPDYVVELLGLKVIDDIEEECRDSNKKEKTIRSIDKLRTIHLLNDISESLGKYQKTINNWVEQLNADS